MFFDDLKLSWLFFIIIIVIAVIVLIVAGLYMLWIYHLGKPLSPFFWLRIKGWTQKGIALFEIFSLTNSVSLEEARKETGDGYRIHTPSIVNIPTNQKVGFIDFWKRKFGLSKKNTKIVSTSTLTPETYSVEKVKRIQNLIMPKSTYSINGVTTIPLWDLHPQLHTDLLEGVKVLVSQGLISLTDLKEFCSDKHQAEQILFKNYSYRTFLDLYLGAKQKFSVTVTTDDVVNFIGKQFDKNYRESIEAKDFNAMQKSKIDNKYTLYGWIAIILTILIVGFKIVYQTIWG